MKKVTMGFAIWVVFAVLTSCAPQQNQNGGQMAGDKLTALIVKIDKDARIDGTVVSFNVKGRELVLIYDVDADRMRVVTPIVPVFNVAESSYKRMLQANYDAALDARYAVANELIWAVFIHPLSSLTDDDFVSGIVQTYTTAETFGSSYSSGAFIFGGGDSNGLHEELLDALEKAADIQDKGI